MDSGIVKRSGRNTASGNRPALRVGGIDYLNALPLTEYLSLEGAPAIELRNLVPSALAMGLRAGDLDVALVPVVEYLERDDYLIIPDICVSSYGAVESIRLYFRRPLADLRRVGLDSSSRTSALLTRLFLRTRWGSRPEVLAIEPAAALRYLASQEAANASAGTGEGLAEAGDLDAVLLIGDTALHRDVPAGWRCVDLGNEWTRLTGLPFVYAFWVCRGDECPRGAAQAELVDRFRRARDVGLSHIDDIVRRYVESARAGETLPAARGAARGNGSARDGGAAVWVEEVRWRQYLSRVIQYEFGPAQREGLEHFFSLLGREGLHPRAPRPLRFVGGSS
jgi:chorismate dehydratase